jgi:hypothetical protein
VRNRPSIKLRSSIIKAGGGKDPKRAPGDSSHRDRTRGTQNDNGPSGQRIDQKKNHSVLIDHVSEADGPTAYISEVLSTGK